MCEHNVVEISEEVFSSVHEAYEEKGFYVLEKSILRAPVERFRARLDAILDGEYDEGCAPTKLPSKAARNAKRDPAKYKLPQTLHMINVHHADALFRSLATSPEIGRLVAKATGWNRVRLAEDQVWMKPPQARALAYHCDTTYFDFTPKEVCTVWITFDSLEDVGVGPLEYCVGSHKWGSEKRRGCAGKFFDSHYRALMLACAEEQTGSSEVDIETVNAEPGGGSIHNGRTWHGSAANTTTSTMRRGMGMHFIHGDAVFQDESEGPISKLWLQFKTPGSNALSDEAFPLVYPEAVSNP